MSNNTTALRTVSEIESDFIAANKKLANFRRLYNEGAGGYSDESEIDALREELAIVTKASCPLALDLAGERAWFKAQGFTAANLQAANAACLARGYSLADLQAAAKAAVAA